MGSKMPGLQMLPPALLVLVAAFAAPAPLHAPQALPWMEVLSVPVQHLTPCGACCCSIPAGGALRGTAALAAAACCPCKTATTSGGYEIACCWAARCAAANFSAAVFSAAIASAAIALAAAVLPLCACDSPIGCVLLSETEVVGCCVPSSCPMHLVCILVVRNEFCPVGI